MMACAAEFENVAVREDELPELDALLISKDNPIPYDVSNGVENKAGKVNVLMQVCVWVGVGLVPLGVCGCGTGAFGGVWVCACGAFGGVWVWD